MTPEERQLLTQFLGDLVQTKGVAKDQEAAAMIETAIRSNPDSAYVLVQHALLADQALHQAQSQIAQMQAQSQAPPPSFLGAGLGPRMNQPQPQSPWGQAAAPPPQASQQPPPYAGSGPFSAGGGLGSFLRTAGTTAAGVAGGEMLFSGLSGLFGGHRGGFGGGFGGGGFDGGGWGGGPVENVTVNNYGDDGGDDGGFGGDGGTDDY